MQTQENVAREDRISTVLRSYAQNILVVIFGLLPVLFIPKIIAPFEYTKTAFIFSGLVIALILGSLSLLRSGIITTGISYSLIALWCVAGFTFLSSALSGDFKDSFIGDLFSIHATIFVVILALIPTVWLFLKAGKASVMRMYFLFAISTLLLVLFHIVRLFFGTEVFSFSIFGDATASPIGSWNDLALFLGLTIIIALIALEQLSLTRVGKSLFVAVTVAALIMLGIINFFMVWIVLGITSLVVIVYALGKDRFTGGQLSLVPQRGNNATSLVVALVVFTISVVFFIGGATIGSTLSKYTNISYIEVRPSVEATANIARNVYTNDALLGVGANKFSDAWRMYRDTSILQTRFWNTDFNAGSGYIMTFFVTTGILGGLSWVAFLIIFCITGVRRLLGAMNGDRMWYFIGVSSFVSAMYIWIMSIVYVPGVVILLLGALCTGISLGAMNVLSGATGKVIEMGRDRRSGFILTLGVITVIVLSVSALYAFGRHYSSVYAFNASIYAMQQGEPIDELERQVEHAFQLSTSDVFARRIAEYQVTRMNALAVKAEPTQEELQQFQTARELGIGAASEAIRIDGSEPANWAVLGGIYSILASLNMEGAHDRAIEAFSRAHELNPRDPLINLERAIVEARAGNYDQSREYIRQAIALKSNYTEAFFLLSQLEIALGNVEAAIGSTQAVISLEPQNAARYYQLGVLEASRKNLKGAILAFEQAVTLDQNYANARYLLALAYDEEGRGEEAKVQLKRVQELNPDNTEVANLLMVLETEGSLGRLRAGTAQTVNEALPQTNNDGTVQTTQEVDTTLVTPVNTVPKQDEEPMVPTDE